MNTKNLLILIIILCIGSLLRLYQLDFQSLWLDELMSMRRASFLDIKDVISATQNSDVHPPGFQVLLWGWIRVFGDEPFQLRLISAVAGIFSIISIYFLTKNIYSNREAIVATSIFSVSWLPIYYSQEARSYSILLFLSITVSIYFYKILIKFINNTSLSRKDIVLYIILAVMTNYIHYFGLYLVFLQGMAVFTIVVVRKKYLKNFIAIYLPILLLYLPWVSSMLDQFNGEVGSHISAPNLDSIVGFIIFFTNNYKLVSFIIALIVLMLLVYKYYKNRVKINFKFSELSFPTIYLVLWSTIPFISLFIISHLIKPVFTIRNMIIIYAPLLLLFVRLITTTLSKKVILNTFLGLFVALLLTNLLLAKNYYHTPTKEQFRESVQHVANEFSKYERGDIVANVYHPEYFDYYFRRFSSNLRVTHFIDIHASHHEISQKLINCNSEYLWLMSAHDKTNSFLLNLILKDYHLLKKNNFIKSEVHLFKRNKPQFVD